MNRYLIDEFYSTPGLRFRLEQAAHRERARAIRAGFAWLAEQARTRLAAFVHAPLGRWTARLG